MPPVKKAKKPAQQPSSPEGSVKAPAESSMALVKVEDSVTDSEENACSHSRVMINTPQKTPRKQKVGGISQPQKNAMIENLKLEIAERSRRLRARYTTQAQYLRQQIEWRIDRVPIKLRNMTMGELLDQFANTSSYHGRNQAIGVVNEVKRLSSGTGTTIEKENAPIVVAKKRPGKTGPIPAAPVASPQKRMHKALSPLRQLPQQQVKSQSQSTRPLSPVKKSSPPGKVKRLVVAKKDKKAAVPSSPTKTAPRRRAGAAAGNHRLSNATDTTSNSSAYASTASKRMVKTVKSNGSFKENNDDGPTFNSSRTAPEKTSSSKVTKAAATRKAAASSTTAAGAGRKRVLRSKK